LLALALAGCGLFGAPPPAWKQAAPLPKEGPVVPGERLQRKTLANGLRLVVLEDRRLPRVVLGMTFRRGASDVPVEQAGLASYTAELLRRGAGERDALAFAEAVESLGASLSATAGWDSTGVVVSGLVRDLDSLSGLLADAVLHPRFEPAEAERVRSQRLAALERAKDSPGTLAQWYLARTLYPGHPFGLPSQGSPETAARLDAAAARAWHTQVFVPGNAIFFATGDVDRSDIEARAEALFGGWRGGDAPQPVGAPATPAPPARKVVVVDRPELVQAQILLGHEGITRSADDRLEVSIMNSILGGGGFSSRIMGRVREDAGLAYFAYSSFVPRRRGGVFVAATGTRVPETARAVEMLLDEIEGARARPFSAGEIRDAKSLAVGRFALSLETSQAIAAGLVDLDVQGLPADSLDTYRARVARLSDAAIQQAAVDYLHPARAAIVVVGPAEALRPQLERFGEVEVVTP
jgi:zinc protease